MAGEILYPRAAVSMKAKRDIRNQQREIAMKNLTALIAIAGFTALSVNAQAGGTSAVPTEIVRYTSSDAANAGTVALLYRRIDAAAGRVCGERLAPGKPFVSRSWQLCVQHAMHDALTQINTPAAASYAATQGVVVYGSTVASRN
jgi:UrcA family protein